MKKSEFKRISTANFETGNDLVTANLYAFLKEANYTLSGGFLDLWIKGDPKTSKDMVVVTVNGSDEDFLNAVIYRTPTGIVVEKCDTMYQTFLAHKEARF